MYSTYKYSGVNAGFRLFVGMVLIFIGQILMSGCKRDMATSNPHYRNLFKVMDSLPVDADKQFLDSVWGISFKKDPPGADEIVGYYVKRAELLMATNPAATIFALDSLESFLQSYPGLPKAGEYYSDLLFARISFYKLTKQYDEGFALLGKAKEHLDAHYKDPCSKLRYDNALANMLFAHGRFRLAAAYFMQLYQTASACDSTSFDGYYQVYSGLFNTGVSYHQARMNDSALYWYNRTLELIDRKAPLLPGNAAYLALSKAVVSSNLGALKYQLGDNKGARPLLEYTLTAIKNDYPSYAWNTAFTLASLYIATQQIDKAKNIINGLDTITNKIYVSDFDVRMSNVKKEYYKTIGDSGAALRYSELSTTIRDSIDDRRRLNLDRDFAMELAAKEQQRINSELRLVNKQTSFRLVLAVVIGAVVLMMALLIWLGFRRAWQYNRKLKLLNEEMAVQKEDLMDTFLTLEKSYQENQSILNIVAHDLKNPLVAIPALVRSIASNVSEADMKHSLELIDTACKNSITLINDITISQSAKLPSLNKEMNDIWRLLEYCTELMKPRAEEKKQNLVVKGEAVEILINKHRIWRVITNLINNAIKFTPEGGVISVELEKVETDIIISVTDNGIGIPEAIQDKIFESAPETQRIGTWGEKSTGLGLKISKKIVEEHSGKLWVESEEGVGSTFFIMLPSGN